MESKDHYTSYILNQINNPSVPIAQRTIDRAKDILKLLNATKINREHLEGYCFQGIPDEFNGLRSLCWKLLLDYLPNCPAKWDSTLKNYQETYQNYLKEYFLPHKNLTLQPPTKYEGDPLNLSQELAKKSKPSEKRKTIDLPLRKHASSLYMTKKKFSEDDPSSDFGPLSEAPLLLKKSLSKGPTNHTQNDAQLYEDISKDTRRTRSGMDFFRKTTDFPMKGVYSKENNKAFEQESHAETMTRILFIYGKLNPNVGYVQGMNEVLAPIYYCFCNDQNPAFSGSAEADSFFCFSKLMLDLHDAFLKGFDNKGVGIQARIKVLNDLLLRIDKQVWDHLEKYSVNPQFYTLRWLMLLLTQEFEMSEVLRLWDTLLSHPKRIKYINYICLAMILQVKNKLIFTDEFAVIMEMMQRDTIQNFDKILPEAFRLYKAHAKDEDLVHHIVFPM